MKSPSYFFEVTTKILADFQICISVPLKKRLRDRYSPEPNCRGGGIKQGGLVFYYKSIDWGRGGGGGDNK